MPCEWPCLPLALTLVETQGNAQLLLQGFYASFQQPDGGITAMRDFQQVCIQQAGQGCSFRCDRPVLLRKGTLLSRGAAQSQLRCETCRGRSHPLRLCPASPASTAAGCCDAALLLLDETASRTSCIFVLTNSSNSIWSTVLRAAVSLPYPSNLPRQYVTVPVYKNLEALAYSTLLTQLLCC